MKKTTLLSSLLLISFPIYAADYSTLSEEQQRRQIEENINQIGHEINQNIKEAGKQLNAAIPAIADNLNTILQTFTSEIIPLMQAMEENRKLIKASDSMAHALEDSLPAQYRQELKYEIDSKNNQLTIIGTIAENEDTTKFNIMRSLAAAAIAQNFITQKNDIENANFFNPDSAKPPANKKLQDLDKNEMPLNEFKLEEINNNIFMVHENPDNHKTFIFGNLNPALTLQVQSQGPNHSQKIRNFIRDLDLSKINQAINTKANDESDINMAIPKFEP